MKVTPKVTPSETHTATAETGNEWLHSFSFEGHNYTLFKRVKTRNAPWCCDFIVDGNRIKRSLKTNNAAAAEALCVKQFIKPAKAGRWTEVENKKAKRTWATLGEVAIKYTALAKGVIADQTASDNLNALRLVVRRGLGNEEMSTEQAHAQSCGVLNGALVTNFQNWMTNDGTKKGRNPESVKRTIKGYLRFTRSVFTESMRDDYKLAGLKLPDLSEFLTKKTHKAARICHVPADERLVAHTFEASKMLRETDRPAYIAWLLSLCSLRRGECRWARRDAIRLYKGSWWLFPGTRTKGKRDRMIPLDQRVKQELDDYHATERDGQPDAEYILPCPALGNGGTKARHRAERIMRRVDKFMRDCGWTTRHTMHEMRAYFLQQIRDNYGLDSTQAVAGHADQKTTSDHYVGTKNVSNIVITLPLEIGSGASKKTMQPIQPPQQNAV